MKLLLAALLSLALSGCAYQKADTSDILAAVAVCGSIDKVLYIRVDFAGEEFVYCQDGSHRNLHRG